MDLTIPGNSASRDHNQAENQHPSFVTAAIPRIIRSLGTNSTPTVFPGGISHNAPPRAQSSAVRAPGAPYSSRQQPISQTSSGQFRNPYSTSAHQEPITQTPSAQYRSPYQSLDSAQQPPATRASSVQILSLNLSLHQQSRAAQYWGPSLNTISAQQQPSTQPVPPQSDSVAVPCHSGAAPLSRHLAATGLGRASAPRLTYYELTASNTSSTSVVTPSSFVEYIPPAKRQKTTPAAESRPVPSPGVTKPPTRSFVKKRAQSYPSSQSSLRQATSVPLLESHRDSPDSGTEFQAVADMAGKKSVKNLLRDEGLQRTDNGMKQTSWPEPQMINQKNYYTDYQKRDDQTLVLRLQNEVNRDKMIRNAKDKDRALARTGTSDIPIFTNTVDEAEEEESSATDGFDLTKIIVVHPGSQNLRIGFASDALPKTIPMCIATGWPRPESKESEPLPKRQKLADAPEDQFGEEFAKKFTKMSNDLKVDMRANKRKVLPNSKELVVNYNKRTPPEKIPEHNDPIRIEWTDVTSRDSKDASDFIAGVEAQRIPDDSVPSYRLSWPIQHGWFHENDYLSREHMIDDFEGIIESALRKDLGLKSSLSWEECMVVCVIPDLYDKKYVEEIADLFLKNMEFKQIAFIQESVAVLSGAALTQACVVDIGAQKVSISCVDDGMIIEDSRVNLKYGGYDVTETFVKMMLFDHFPYQDINLKRRYDFLLAEELKKDFCTMRQADISVQLYNFHLRAPNQPTAKYLFKTYDEPILAPMGFFDPSYFDNSEKLEGRRSLIDRSYNAYDPDMPDDPSSAAQLAILTSIKPSLATSAGIGINGNGHPDFSTPQKEKPNPFNHLSRMDSQANGDSRVTSAAASPAPEGANTPAPYVFGANGKGGSPAPNGNLPNGSHNSGTPIPPTGVFVDPLARTQVDIAIERDSVLPIAPLDTAIITAITHAAKGDEKRLKEFFGGILLVGGGAKIPGLHTFLEARLRSKRPDLGDKILVGTSPREMDPQVVAWKGASVQGQLKLHESWIGKLEWDMLGSRAFHGKLLWHYW